MHSYFAEVKVMFNNVKYGAFNVHPVNGNAGDMPMIENDMMLGEKQHDKKWTL